MGKKSGDVTICCPNCKGKGRIKLTGKYRDTLNELQKQRKPTTGAALARVMDVKPSAMNNRLAALCRADLVTFTQYGQAKLFQVKPR